MLQLKSFTVDHDRPMMHSPIYFHYAFRFYITQILALMLDSLVRVSRRAVYKHFVFTFRNHEVFAIYKKKQPSHTTTKQKDISTHNTQH